MDNPNRLGGDFSELQFTHFKKTDADDKVFLQTITNRLFDLCYDISNPIIFYKYLRLESNQRVAWTRWNIDCKTIDSLTGDET